VKINRKVWGSVCNAQPLRGDGSLLCDLAPFHPGWHEGPGIRGEGRTEFRAIVPGTSARAKALAGQRRARVMRRIYPQSGDEL
jgi:hypothetical protein